MKFPAFLLALSIAAVPSLAQAHFLWASLDSTSHTVSIGLQEFPGVEPASLKDHVPHVKAWAKPSGYLSLKQDGQWLKGGTMEDFVGVSLNYGVLDKREEGRGLFWLNYYAKAAVSPQASQAKLGLPVELFAEINAEGKPVITVLRDGKPASKAAIVAELPGKEIPFKGETGADGTIVLPAISGKLAVRALVTENEKGTEGGKAYDSQKSYGTLTVNDISSRAMRFAADPKAYDLLRKASETRQTMPKDLLEVTGTVEYVHEGKTVAGKFTFKPGTRATVDQSGLGKVAGAELDGQVASLFNHRQSVPFASSNGKYTLKVLKEDEAGVLVSIGDGQDSTMRVKNDEIVEVSRSMHGNRFIISTLENIRTKGGKSLPKIYVVSYYDPTTDALTKAQFFTDQYTEVNGVWLPLSREIKTAQDGKVSTVQLKFSDLKVKRGTP